MSARLPDRDTDHRWSRGERSYSYQPRHVHKWHYVPPERRGFAAGPRAHTWSPLRVPRHTGSPERKRRHSHSGHHRGRHRSRDLEQARRPSSSSSSTSSSSSSLSSNRIIGPTVTVVDVDATGHATRGDRCPAGEVRESAAPAPRPGHVRITIRAVSTAQDHVRSFKPPEGVGKRLGPCYSMCQGMYDSYRDWRERRAVRKSLREGIIWFASSIMGLDRIPPVAAKLFYEPGLVLMKPFDVALLSRLWQGANNGKRLEYTVEIAHPLVLTHGVSYGSSDSIALELRSFGLARRAFFLGPAKLFSGTKIQTEFYRSGANLCVERVGDAMNVTCYFPSSLRVNCFPTEEAFVNLLLSDRSSLRFCNGNPTTTSQLVALDFLRNTMAFWNDFFRAVEWLSSRMPKPNATTEDFVQDSTISCTIKRAMGECYRCISFLIESITPALEPTFSRRQSGVGGKADWDNLVLETYTCMEELQAAAGNVHKQSGDNFDFFVALMNERQAQGVKRLTVLTAIFLPLTLAASLLSMSKPASSLGWLWFDWAGLCLSVGFSAVVGYSVWRWLSELPTTMGLKSWKAFSTVPGLRRLSTIVMTLVWILAAVTVAAFLAGVFGERRLATGVLRYGMGVGAGLWAVFILLMQLPRAVTVVVATWEIGRVFVAIRSKGLSFRRVAQMMIGPARPKAMHQPERRHHRHHHLGSESEWRTLLEILVSRERVKASIHKRNGSLRAALSIVFSLWEATPAGREALDMVRRFAEEEKSIKEMLEGLI